MKFELRRLNRALLGKLVIASLLMFGFGFAMVPIYESICEITGVNVLTQRDESAEAFARNTQVDTTRRVTVEFDANSHGPWQFKPEIGSVSAHPGELVTVQYALTNRTIHPVAGQAIPSYAPKHASEYFKKLECFCFRQQALNGGETRRFTVVFVLDPQLPNDVHNITLSYTFFEVGGSSASSSAGTGSMGLPKALYGS
jgi:cytochrome c oxidase assembly protein subunit 11